MKKILLLFMVIATASSCQEQKQERSKNAELVQDNLQGNVNGIVETDYKVDSTGQIGDQDSCCVVSFAYDPKGYLTEFGREDKAGTEKAKESYVHYENGAMKDIRNSKNGKPDSRIAIDIDDKGNYTGAREYDSTDKLSFYYKDIAANDYGQLTNLKQYKPDSTLKATMKTNYDQQFYSGGSSTDSVGNETFSSSVKRDNKNNVVETTTKNVTKDSTTNKVVKYTYETFDENGNWTQRTELDESGKPVKVTKRTITYYKK